MELTLVGKSQCSARVEISQRGPLDELDLIEAELVGHLQFFIEIVVALFGFEQVPVETREIAIDLFHRYDLLDLIDRSSVALPRKPGFIFAVPSCDAIEPVVDRGREMRRRSRCL